MSYIFFMFQAKNIQSFFIVITGPTGVGKSDFALRLATALSGEIVNCDVGQFYTPLAIGTAKPDWRREIIPHHLFDILSEPGNFTVARYRTGVQELLRDISSRGKVPILVGGSGFYVNALFFPPVSAEMPNGVVGLCRGQNNTACLEQARDLSEISWKTLHALDPERAERIDPHDFYRIERAITLYRETGLLPSQQAPVYSPLGKSLVIHVTRDREDLYDRINRRTVEMFGAEWLAEVEVLSPEWKAFLKNKKLIGYPEIIQYLEQQEQGHNPDKELLVELIQQKTRNYAKRQLTFWRSLNKRLIDQGCQTGEINLTLLDLDLYIEQLVKQLIEHRAGVQ